VIGFIDQILAVARPVFLGLAGVLGVVAGLDWMVRTRRINPFGRTARVLRRSVDPLLMPLERRVVRAGGMPAHAPLWGLMAVVLAGIAVFAVLGFLRNQIALVLGSVEAGPRGIYRLAVSWTITVLQVAIVARVIMSWIHVRPGAWYARWSYRLSEPILRPIRNALPLFGTIDVSPIAAWFALIIVESLLLATW
jgi:YggT family protein